MRRPIAVFDSGLGGLSVVRALRDLLPAEDLVYFGDTARVPYGIKSRRTVAQFALEDARFLLRYEPKLIVAACNTASALAMSELEAGLPLPVVGVVRPGARAAVRAARGRPIAIIGTEATIGSRAYESAIRRLDPAADVHALACPLFVPLVEEGRGCDDPIVRLTVATYLGPLGRLGLGAIVLGCTHYPLLRDAIAAQLGPAVAIVESGEETARAVRDVLEATGDLCSSSAPGTMQCFVSDNPARFRSIGSGFLGHELEHVELVEPQQYIASARLEEPTP